MHVRRPEGGRRRRRRRLPADVLGEELGDPRAHDVWALLRAEVPGAVDEFPTQVIAVRFDALELARGNVEVLAAEQKQARHGEPS